MKFPFYIFLKKKVKKIGAKCFCYFYKHEICCILKKKQTIEKSAQEAIESQQNSHVEIVRKEKINKN